MIKVRNDNQNHIGGYENDYTKKALYLKLITFKYLHHHKILPLQAQRFLRRLIPVSWLPNSAQFPMYIFSVSFLMRKEKKKKKINVHGALVHFTWLSPTYQRQMVIMFRKGLTLNIEQQGLQKISLPPHDTAILVLSLNKENYW